MPRQMTVKSWLSEHMSKIRFSKMTCLNNDSNVVGHFVRNKSDIKKFSIFVTAVEFNKSKDIAFQRKFIEKFHLA